MTDYYYYHYEINRIDIYGYMTPYNLQDFFYALSHSRLIRTLEGIGIMIPISQSRRLRCRLLMRRKDHVLFPTMLHLVKVDGTADGSLYTRLPAQDLGEVQ